MRTIRGGFKQREDAAAGEIAQPRRIHHPFPGQDLALMNNLVYVPLLTLAPTLAAAAEKPDWAFPVTGKVQPRSNDDGRPRTAPGSSLSLTRAQIEDGYNPPDWYPNAHPTMPQIVARGDKATARFAICPSARGDICTAA